MPPTQSDRDRLLASAALISKPAAAFGDYRAARREHAWVLRSEGLTFAAIGARLGITAACASDLIWRQHRRELRAGRDDGGIMKLKRISEKSRAELLAEIAELPSSTFIPPAQAAAYIGSTSSVLHCWRSQRRGPRYHGSHEFIRYRISDLDLWMATRANEVDLQSVVDGEDPLSRRRQLRVIENETATIT
jgi:hypothetical protein